MVICSVILGDRCKRSLIFRVLTAKNMTPWYHVNNPCHMTEVKWGQKLPLSKYFSTFDRMLGVFLSDFWISVSDWHVLKYVMSNYYESWHVTFRWRHILIVQASKQWFQICFIFLVRNNIVNWAPRQFFLKFRGQMGPFLRSNRTYRVFLFGLICEVL